MQNSNPVLWILITLIGSDGRSSSCNGTTDPPGDHLYSNFNAFNCPSITAVSLHKKIPIGQWSLNLYLSIRFRVYDRWSSITYWAFEVRSSSHSKWHSVVWITFLWTHETTVYVWGGVGTRVSRSVPFRRPKCVEKEATTHTEERHSPRLGDDAMSY